MGAEKIMSFLSPSHFLNLNNLKFWKADEGSNSHIISLGILPVLSIRMLGMKTSVDKDLFLKIRFHSITDFRPEVDRRRSSVLSLGSCYVSIQF